MVTATLVAVAMVLACLATGLAILAPSGTAMGPAARPRADGIAGLTGLAVLTWVGGWLVLAGVYSAVAGGALLALGVSLGCGALFLRRRRVGPQPAGEQIAPRQIPVGALLLGLLSLAVALVRILGELIVPFVEPWDDWPSYWHFPRLLLESGSFVEPFSFRRLSALGAAPFAQSFFWPGFRIAANGMTDAVLGQLLLWAVVRTIPNALSTRPQPAWMGEALALAALLISLTIPNPNSQPTLLPMAGALGLMLLTQRLTTSASTTSTSTTNVGTTSDSTTNGVSTAIAWGLVAAWLIGLRTSNVAFPAGLWLVGALMAARHRDARQGVHLGLAGLVTLIGLLPWSLALWRSSGTPLYPLIAGNYRFAENLYSVPLDGPGLVALVMDRLWVSRVWIIAALGAVAALSPWVRRVSIQVVVALLLLVAVSAAATTGLDAITVHRLSAPFLAAGVVLVTGALLSDGPATTRRDQRPLILWAGLALWFFLPVTLPDGAWEVPASNRSMFEYQAMRRATAAVTAWQLEEMPAEPQRGHYEAAQARLPADARLVSATERPYLFRRDQQVVHTLEFLGVVSPAPGMPFFKGPEPLAQYLRDLGYTHLAFTPAPFAPFGQETVEFANPITGIDKLLPYMADFASSTERLEQAYPIIYRAPELVVIDLRQANLRQTRPTDVPGQPR